jgi:GNAT superfamily N-acetyltransferase
VASETPFPSVTLSSGLTVTGSSLRGLLPTVRDFESYEFADPYSDLVWKWAEKTSTDGSESAFAICPMVVESIGEDRWAVQFAGFFVAQNQEPDGTELPYLELKRFSVVRFRRGKGIGSHFLGVFESLAEKLEKPLRTLVPQDRGHLPVHRLLSARGWRLRTVPDDYYEAVWRPGRRIEEPEVVDGEGPIPEFTLTL